MATPYFQYIVESVPSTQDMARDRLADLPVLVIASSQTAGRGRSGSSWENAPRAFAASYAFHHASDDDRPISLIAGVAATRSIDEVTLKWPNDVLKKEHKVGGILVERSGTTTVVGFGLNLWWPSAPDGFGAVFEEEPPEPRHIEMAALWGAELARLLDSPGWPIAEYRRSCVTLGRDITWEPDGVGRAIDISPDGGLTVETRSGIETIRSGEVRNVRA